MTKKRILNILVTLIFAAILFYIMIPPINIQSIPFWIYLVVVIGMYALLEMINKYQRHTILDIKMTKVPLVIGVFVLAVILINIFYSPLINASMYAKRISVDESGDFTTDIKQVDFSTLPLLDRDSSMKLGDRVMGQMPELVSQFDVSELYTQINYKGRVVRVTPLEYNGIFKYFTNRKEGVKGYISVDSVDGNATLTKLDQGMKYVPSAMFNENLYRKLRFQYPTFMFGEEYFELNEEGEPFWIVPVLKYKGIGLLEDVKGVVILDPITGKSSYHQVNDVPTWVDHVYPANLLIEQTDDWGKYRNGFFNSIIGQKNVVKTTRGYNYIAKDDDIYLYTGITSALADEANIGFILSNMRTKETIFYAVPGAEEYSAMESAKGQVQQMNYTASFPLLINLNNKPTYLISLKDNAGLVKMYAFVDVQDYQRVVVTDSSQGIEQAALNYLGDEQINTPIDKGNLKYKTITVQSITNSMIDGNSFYYIKDSDGLKYRVKISVDEKNIPFIQVGDQLSIGYLLEEDVTEIMEISE